MGFGVNRCVRHKTPVPVFFVPHAAVGQQDRTVNGDGPAIGRPRLEQCDQVTP